MEFELVAMGLNGAAVALAAGCVVLVRLTAKNFQGKNPSAVSTKVEMDAASTRSPTEPTLSSIRTTFSEFRSVAGNTALLRRLSLPHELDPSLLVDGVKLSSAAASIGFSNIELVMRAILNEHPSTNPYLFGVNRGGSLLANLLSSRLRLDQKHLVKCDYKPAWKKLMCEDRPNVRLVIVIDDAVRSGETLEAVTRGLRDKHPEAIMYVLALVVSAAEAETDISQKRKLRSLVDYYPWVTLSAHTKLPWSDELSDEASDFIDADGIDQLVGRLLSHSAASEAGPDLPQGYRI